MRPFRGTGRAVIGVRNYYVDIYYLLSLSLNFLTDEKLITESEKMEIWDLLRYFWDLLLLNSEVTEFQYLTFYNSTNVSPSSNYERSYEIGVNDSSKLEDLLKDLTKEFQKHWTVNFKRVSSQYGNDLPYDLVEIFRNHGLASTEDSLDYKITIAVASTYSRILRLTDTQSRMERIGMRMLSTETLPVFLSLWFFKSDI